MLGSIRVLHFDKLATPLAINDPHTRRKRVLPPDERINAAIIGPLLTAAVDPRKLYGNLVRPRRVDQGYMQLFENFGMFIILGGGRSHKNLEINFTPLLTGVYINFGTTLKEGCAFIFTTPCRGCKNLQPPSG